MFTVLLPILMMPLLLSRELKRRGHCFPVSLDRIKSSLLIWCAGMAVAQYFFGMHFGLLSRGGLVPWFFLLNLALAWAISRIFSLYMVGVSGREVVCVGTDLDSLSSLLENNLNLERNGNGAVTRFEYKGQECLRAREIASLEKLVRTSHGYGLRGILRHPATGESRIVPLLFSRSLLISSTAGADQALMMHVCRVILDADREKVPLTVPSRDIECLYMLILSFIVLSVEMK